MPVFFRCVALGRSIGSSVARVVPVCRQPHGFSEFPVKAFPRPENNMVIGARLRVGAYGEESANG